MRLLAAITSIVIITFLAVSPKHLAANIERDITYRVESALANHGLAFALAEPDGRHVVLTGYAPDEDAKQGAAEIAGGVWGVESLDNQLQVSVAGEDMGTSVNETGPAIGTRFESESIIPAPWVDPFQDQAKSRFEHYVDYMPMISKNPLSPSEPLSIEACQEILTELMETEAIQFEVNSASITQKSLSLLDNLAETVLRCPPDAIIEVGGHTDNIGPSGYNQQLSKKRADAVAAFLLDKKVDAEKLRTKGYGDSEPIADNDTREGRAKNRRIEFKVLQ
jgi:outer membrane protein OmpA-like peptidoglycan-associated protein